MACATIAVMHIGYYISTTVAGAAGAGPQEVCRIVSSMTYSAVCMTIQAAHRSSCHDDIVDGGIAASKTGGPGRVMALRAAKLMQGTDTIRARPGVGEQRITRSRSTSPVACITSGRG